MIETLSEDGLDREWGLPLTEQEAHELNTRAGRMRKARPAIEALSESASFAGAYYDHSRGGLPVFLVTGGMAEARGLIDDRIGAMEYELVRVDRSLADLDALRDRVRAHAARLEEAGAGLARINYDIQRNRVVAVVVDRRTEAREILGDTEGLTVELGEYGQPDACTYLDCPKAKGGIQLLGDVNDTPVCTAGFVAKRLDGQDHLVLLTAGHCKQWSQQNSTSWWHHLPRPIEANRIGVNEHRIWSTAAADQPIAADVLVIDIDGDFVPDGNKNKLLTKKNANLANSLGTVNAVAGFGF